MVFEPFNPTKLKCPSQNTIISGKNSALVFSMEVWDDVGFVYASKYRTKIVKLLLEHNSTPSAIAKETKIETSHVSRTLSQLERKGIVKCLTPNRLKGRIYQLTPKGADIAKRIEKNIG